MITTILWYDGVTLLDRAIMHFTHGPYSHTAIYLRGVLYEEGAKGLTLYGGQHAVDRANNAVGYKSIALEDGQGNAIEAQLHKMMGHGYNYAALLSDALAATLGFSLIVAGDERFDCSAAVASALREAGYVWPKDDRLMSPNDLAEALQPVLQGSPHLLIMSTPGKGVQSAGPGD